MHPALTDAANLRMAAERLRAQALADPDSVLVREVFDDVARTLGELGATTEAVVRAQRVASPPYELVRRGDELTSSLIAARRNAELVCRHAPAGRAVPA